MRIQSVLWCDRKGWLLDNGEVRVVLLRAGGHIASLTRVDEPDLNPLWAPHWPVVEPWAYREREHGARYGSRLLASICGHNVCLPWFGDPSPDERKQGLDIHGEAGLARWRLVSRARSAGRLSAEFSCELPCSGMSLRRVIRLRQGSPVIHVRERVINRTRRDQPYAWCQHVTVGAPFLEKGVTCFDLPAREGRTFPGAFGDPQRLKSDTAFRWPSGPGARGERVDLRLLSKRYRKSSDCYVLRMDPSQDWAWFSALHPKRGLVLAYAWKRADFPWVGTWEENGARTVPPWDGRELTRGLEFTTAPFPNGLRAAMELGRLHGEPVVRWLPARGCVEVSYAMLWQRAPATAQGVAGIRPASGGLRVEWR